MPPRLRATRPAFKSLTSPRLQQCLYHSYDHPPPPGPFPPLETKILSASLPHIPLHGFTPKTLSLGLADSGLPPATHNLFPAGAFALVQYHLYTQRIALADALKKLQRENGAENGIGGAIKKPLGIGATVKALTWARLLANEPIIHQYQEALALMALPSNVSPSLLELHNLADEIWFLANDKSVDTSWYTKRASLAAIYATSEVFMTRDRSEGFQETREFMDRRFEGVRWLGVGAGSLGEWVGFSALATVNVLRSKGVRI